MPKKKKFYCLIYRDEKNVFKKESDVRSFIEDNPDFDGLSKEFESLEAAELWGEVQELKSIMEGPPEEPRQFDGSKIAKTFKEIAKLYKESPNLSARKMGLCYDKLSELFLK